MRLSAGEFDTVKVVRKYDQADRRAIEIWLATNQSHMPVKIAVTDRDGTRIETVAVRIVAQ